MQKKLKVAVWCLVYNHEKYIRQCLDGFVAQKTTFDFQVFVHDDCSMDGTSSILMEYVDRYPDLIVPIVEKENQWKRGGLKHIVDIMNENYRLGDYIAICEGDDYWTSPDKLQRQVEFLDANPGYSMCFHSAKKVYECDATCWIDCEHIEDRDYTANEIFVNWTIPTASVLLRSKCMEYFATLKGAERVQNYDIVVFLCCAMLGRMRGMNPQMSVYRIQERGLTYDSVALVKTTMRNPAHFHFIKDNFPIVDAKYINWTISKTLFERALIQNSVFEAMKDCWHSFVADPFCFIPMLCRHCGKLFFNMRK